MHSQNSGFLFPPTATIQKADNLPNEQTYLVKGALCGRKGKAKGMEED